MTEIVWDMNEIVWDAIPGEIDQDHERLDVPAVTLLFHRTGHMSYTEVTWMHGYPGTGMITITTMPLTHEGRDIAGVVVTQPVGWRDMADAEAFRAKVYRFATAYENQGWVRKNIAVPAGDPWDVPSVLDRPPTF
jgi:hypothetical protein